MLIVRYMFSSVIRLLDLGCIGDDELSRHQCKEGNIVSYMTYTKSVKFKMSCIMTKAKIPHGTLPERYCVLISEHMGAVFLPPSV